MNKQIYYHFLSPDNAFDDMEKKRIKVSLIKELNDPFELLPYLRYDPLEKRNPYYKVRISVSKKYGILCFSGKWANPLLWGHYAEKHRGIAIGFEVLTDKILDVNYTEIRPKIRLTNDPEKNEKLFLDLFKEKYLGWSYEEESRVLVELSDCESENKLQFLHFHNRLVVKEIILGARFDKKDLHKVRNLANKLNAEVIFARLNWGEYKIVKDGRKTSSYIK